ncbi:hypothetical protein [Rubrobacter calidifluminis]|nr:hypothetical protein [Rubrobacter calidifluminis]
MGGKVRQRVVGAQQRGWSMVCEPEDDRRLRLRLGELKGDLDRP